MAKCKLEEIERRCSDLPLAKLHNLQLCVSSNVFQFSARTQHGAPSTLNASAPGFFFTSKHPRRELTGMQPPKPLPMTPPPLWQRLFL